MFHCILYIPVDGVGVGCVLPVKINMGDGYGYQFEEDFTYIMAFSFIDGGSQVTWKNSVTGGKSPVANDTIRTQP
jgi:hypothetical protein